MLNIILNKIGISVGIAAATKQKAKTQLLDHAHDGRLYS